MTNFKEGFFGKFEEEKRNLYLVYGDTEELIKENVSLDEAFHEMNQYLDKVNFKSYYIRTWDASKGLENCMIMDFGSHYKFFHWADRPRKEPKPTYEQFAKTVNETLEDVREEG